MNQRLKCDTSSLRHRVSECLTVSVQREPPGKDPFFPPLALEELLTAARQARPGWIHSRQRDLVSAEAVGKGMEMGGHSGHGHMRLKLIPGP